MKKTRSKTDNNTTNETNTQIKTQAQKQALKQTLTQTSIINQNIKAMKKQVIFTVLALFAGLTTAVSQTCTPGPLSPSAGTPYTYKVLIGNPPYNGATGDFTWYVTTNVDLLNATGVLPSPGTEIIASGVYNAPATGQDTIQITWTAQAIVNGMTNPYYLVVKFAGNNGTCDAMNLKVWEVTPINTFLLAINSMGGAGNDGTYCAADVSSAIVTPGASPTVAYEYGTNILYARVNASNYAGEWKPSFRIDGLDAVQTLASVTWATDSLFTVEHTTTLAGNVATSTDLATAAYDGSLPIYVKFEVDNNYFETLADLPITLAVDGIIEVGATTLDDVISETDCNPEVVFGKFVDQTIMARPTMTPDPATGSFIVKNP